MKSNSDKDAILASADKDDRLEHALYHVLISRIENALKLDPCPAISLSGTLTHNLIRDARLFLAQMDSEKPWE